MLVGIDLATNLLAAIGATDTKIPLTSVGSLPTVVGTANHLYLRLDDGTKNEIVKVVSADATSVTVVRGQFGTTPQSFVKGVCVSPYTGIGFLCELIAQGGCTAVAQPTACTPVSLATQSMPDAVIGKPWTGVIAYSNASTVTLLSKPDWVTGTLTGGTMVLTGTPPAGVIDAAIVARADGCNNSISLVNTAVKVCAQVGV